MSFFVGNLVRNTSRLLFFFFGKVGVIFFFWCGLVLEKERGKGLIATHLTHTEGKHEHSKAASEHSKAASEHSTLKILKKQKKDRVFCLCAQSRENKKGEKMC